MADTVPTNLHFAAPEEFIRTVLDRMRRYDIRHLPVVEGERLVGIVSDRDLLLHAWSGHRHTFPDDLTVRDIMSSEVVTAPFGTPVSELAAMMLAMRIDAIPLLGPEGGVTGIVTSTDVVRLVAERHDELGASCHTPEFMNRFRWDMPEII